MKNFRLFLFETATEPKHETWLKTAVDYDTVVSAEDRATLLAKINVGEGKECVCVIAHLIPTQKVTNLSRHNRKGGKNDKPISIVDYEGHYYVIDGHHRVCQKIDAGLKTINAKVYSL